MQANLTELQHLLDDATARHLFPCAVLAVIRPNTPALFLQSGTLTYASPQQPSPDSLFDLASLTKVISTTTLAMQLVTSGQLELDRPVREYLPDFPSPVPTVRMLLAHCSGLPAGAPFYRSYANLTSREEKKAVIRATKLTYTPCSDTVYSDIGFLLLGQIIEYITQSTLDCLASQRIFQPLGMANSLFCPSCGTIPTEEINEKPGTYWTGSVHDENARWLGGIAGHAGLFSTAHDLAIFARTLLEGLPPNVSQETFALFTRRACLAPDSARCLGWTSPVPGCAGGAYASPSSFGHTGFTGTSIWIDRTNAIAVVLLTNAVHPHRECKSNGYFARRNEIHEAAYRL